MRTCDLMTTSRFARYLRETKSGALRIDRAAIREEEKLDGKWVITSNDDTLTAEDLALGYQQLMRVEQAGHTMKSGLRPRPRRPPPPAPHPARPARQRRWGSLVTGADRVLSP